MEFMLGVNYWDSKSGTDMWRNYDADVIRADVKVLAEYGVKYMRVFPNWRDFQPVQEYLGWRGFSHGYCDYDEKSLANEDGIDENMIAHFREFAEICREYGISLVVSIVTGWMSGRLFIPRVLIGKNVMTDPEALKWTNRFIRGFVSRVKDIPNIVMWDLGNECNNLGATSTDTQAYAWTAFVRNAIAAADPTREISSGMHGLSSDGSWWTIRTQGELTDYLTPHPYVSKSVKNDIDPMNTSRTTVYPTAQCMFYQDIGGKPVILQEQGSFSEALGNADQVADFVRVNILSSFIHGVHGYFWWCGMNHDGLPNAPYIWSVLERDLGLVDSNRKPKKVAFALKEAGEIIKNLPFSEMPSRKTDCVCLLTPEQNHWDCAGPTFVLGKQAGLEMSFTTNDVPLPKSRLYLLPCISGWGGMYQDTQDALFANVRDGATVLVTYNGGQFSHFEEFFGLRSHGIVTSKRGHTAKFSSGEYHYWVNQEILVESTGAEVLVTNEEGNIVFSRHSYGKGFVYFLNIPMETSLSGTYGAFGNRLYSDIYRTAFASYLAEKTVRTDNFELALMLHEDNLVSVINYTDREQVCMLRVKDGMKLTPVYGNDTVIPKCSCALFRLEKI